MLENLHVQNFRALKDLTIEKTARINLIVGSNNVGKTSLLEAMYFLLSNINEANSLESAFRFDLSNANFWEGVNKEIDPIVIKGMVDNEEEKRSRKSNGAMEASKNHAGHAIAINIAPFKLVDLQAQYQAAYDKGVKPKLIQLLQEIDPTTVNFEPSKLSGNIWTIKIENDYKYPVDISSMGQGFTRAFGLYCRLLASGRDIALIDKVEVGMHHKSLPVLWKALFSASESANIQIFATTHSNECIQAATEIFKDCPEMFQLIRLEKTTHGVQAKCIPHEYAKAALEHDVEIR